MTKRSPLESCDNGCCGRFVVGGARHARLFLNRHRESAQRHSHFLAAAISQRRASSALCVAIAAAAEVPSEIHISSAVDGGDRRNSVERPHRRVDVQRMRRLMSGIPHGGFRVLWANDKDPHAQETYCLNHPDTILDSRDIRTVPASDILNAIPSEAR